MKLCNNNNFFEFLVDFKVFLVLFVDVGDFFLNRNVVRLKIIIVDVRFK